VVVRDSDGAPVSRRRYWLLVAAGGFYIVLGVFVFVLSCFQAIHDYVTLDMYKLTVLPTDNGTDHCGMSTALV